MTLRERLRRVHADEQGSTLTELLVGGVVTAIVTIGVSSVLFTSMALQRGAQDRNDLAASVALVSLVLDRDGAMAAADAPARDQATATDCGTAIDLGFTEAGATVRLRTVASATDGPRWLQRVSGAGARTIARHVASCTWTAVQEAGGGWTLRLDLTLTGPSGESVTRTLRAAPRLW
jgi:Tfp pilus assembly protein PilW